MMKEKSTTILNSIIFVIIILLFIPLIIFISLIWVITLPFWEFSERKEYKSSNYFKHFNFPYNKSIVHSPRYVFYNSVTEKGLDKLYNIRYVFQKSNRFEYFIFDNTVFLFPDFNKIRYDENKNEWNFIYIKYSEESYKPIDSYIEWYEQFLDGDARFLPVKVIVEASMFEADELDLNTIPDSLWVVRKYEKAFEETDWHIISGVPKDTKKLYSMLLHNPDICGSFELKNDDLLMWSFDNLYLDIYADRKEFLVRVSYAPVNKKNNCRKWLRELTHWHSGSDEIYDEICSIACYGSALVVKTFFFGAEDVLYSGDKKKCPYRKTEKHLFSTIHYFEMPDRSL